MKTLQRNFTTPEQSKRLLELGVPADSADCYINLRNNYPYGILSENESYSDYKLAGYMNDPKVLPCWSVGRLIEILEITLGTPWSDNEELGESTLIERVVRDLEYVVKYKEIFKDNRIDFSKLEG